MGSETRKKTEIIRVRATPDEYAEIHDLAAQCDLTVPEYIRRTALGYSPKSNVDNRLYELLENLYGDHGRLGGLLKLWLSNQSIKQKGKALNIDQLINDIRNNQQQLKHKVKELFL